MKIKLINEIRLFLCGWCFVLILWIVPKNDVEGLVIIKAITDWAKSVSLYKNIKKKGNCSENKTNYA